MSVKRVQPVGVWLAIAVSLTVVAVHEATSQRLSAALLERVDQMVRDELAKDGIGGVTVGIVAGPRLIWTRSYGLADVDQKRPADEHTIYRIGSITKPFTALALLQLAEAGKLRLTDPVEQYVPEISAVKGRVPGAPPITLVQLATMTSGLAREPDDLKQFLVGPVAKWKDVMISALDHTSYAHPPDTQYLYSNIGYAVLGGAVERAAGQPFTAYVTDRIFSPLGMTDTAFEPNDRIRPRIATGYDLGRNGELDTETPRREHDGRGYKVPNGAMYTTVSDLAKYISLMLGHGPSAIIKKETLDANFTRLNSASGNLSSGYGIGFQIERRGTIVLHGHGGSVAGYNAAMWYSRDRQIGVIVLRNVGGGKFSVGRLAQAVFTLGSTD